MLKDSKFFGLGPDQANILMPEYSKSYFNTYGYTNLHNFWFELLVDYGIVIFLIFLLFYILLFSYNFILFYESKNLKIGLIYLINLSGLMGFVISSCSVSSLLTRPVVWIFLSFILFNSIFYRKNDE